MTVAMVYYVNANQGWKDLTLRPLYVLVSVPPVSKCSSQFLPSLLSHLQNTNFAAQVFMCISESEGCEF